MITCLCQHDLRIYCGKKNGQVEVFDMNVVLVSSLKGHGREVVAIAAEGDIFVSAGRDRMVHVWDSQDQVRRCQPHKRYF